MTGRIGQNEYKGGIWNVSGVQRVLGITIGKKTITEVAVWDKNAIKLH